MVLSLHFIFSCCGTPGRTRIALHKNCANSCVLTPLRTRPQATRLLPLSYIQLVPFAATSFLQVTYTRRFLSPHQLGVYARLALGNISRHYPPLPVPVAATLPFTALRRPSRPFPFPACSFTRPLCCNLTRLISSSTVSSALE